MAIQFSRKFYKQSELKKSISVASHCCSHLIGIRKKRDDLIELFN